MFRILPLLTLTVFITTTGISNDAVLALLTEGGGSIQTRDNVPGLIALTSERAFAVLKDAKGNAIAAAGETLDGKGGRVIVFSHDGFLKNQSLLEQSALVALLTNSVKWCGRSSKPEVTLHPALSGLAERLESVGIKTKMALPGDVKSSRPPSVYVTVAQKGFDDADVDHLLPLAAKGMGLVLAATPWPFADAYPNFADFPANRLAAPVGISLHSGGTADRTEEIAVTFTSSQIALDALAALSPGGAKLTPSERESRIKDLKGGTSLRGTALDSFLTGLKALHDMVGPITPTMEKPLIPGTDPLIDAIVEIEDVLNQTLPAGHMYAIPAADDYPGAVPKEAHRIEKKVTIDGTWRGWLSGRGAGGWGAKEMRPTGLYAAPGEIITVTAPSEFQGTGFEIVIGAYNGNLSDRDKWNRYPRLQRATEIAGPITTISNALGGLITIRVPKGAAFSSLDFTVSGGVEAPLYLAGKTDLREWKERIRKAPAPWAEIGSDRIILAIPSSFIRDLDDPDKVMQVWGEIIDKAAVLCGGVDRGIYRAERIVFERQPSAGYMHSGYPVAAPQDKSANQAVDSRSLRTEGNWGFFHEYGHNHQHDLWALPGTGETTCNLWSVYLFEEYVGKKREEGHNSIRPLDRKQRMNAYFQGGRRFESEWSMWLALESYLQVQEKFGWEPFQKVFAEYNALPESEWPKTQQEKNDQWVIRLSRACGKNLAPFWSAWNLPLSPTVASELDSLPVWEDHPVATLVK